MEASQRSVCARTEGKKKCISKVSFKHTRDEKEFMCYSQLWYNGSRAEEEVAAELLARPDKWQFSRSDPVTGSQPPSCWSYDAVRTYSSSKREKHLHPVSFFPPQLIFLIYDVFCHERQTASTFCTTNLQTRIKKNHSPDPEELLGSVYFVVFLLLRNEFHGPATQTIKATNFSTKLTAVAGTSCFLKAGMQFDSVGLELSTLLDTKPQSRTKINGFEPMHFFQIPLVSLCGFTLCSGPKLRE